MTPPKTNAMRLLDRAQIPYQVLSYAADESELSGLDAARILGVDPEMVYKTLVLTGSSNPVLVCLLPAPHSLDLKKLAALSGDKRVSPVHMKDLLRLTGYLRGGCSPIGMKKDFPVFADKCLTNQDQVLVNAGKRGVQLKLAPRDLIDYCRIVLGDVLQE